MANLRQALHEEIDRLPEKYRVPIILCDLEELTRDEAAHRLGWRPGTVAGRLARARARLRDRVVRRGQVDLGAVTLLRGVRSAGHCEVPVAWINTVAKLLASSPSGSMEFTEVLAQGVISAMTLAKFKFIAAALFAGALASTIAAWAVVVEARPETGPIAAAISVQQSTTANGGSAGQAKATPAVRPVAGTIVDHEGKPANGARVFYSARRQLQFRPGPGGNTWPMQRPVHTGGPHGRRHLSGLDWNRIALGLSTGITRCIDAGSSWLPSEGIRPAVGPGATCPGGF